MLKIKRLFKSFTYAFRGLYKTFKEEQNLQIQFVAALAIVALSVWLGIKPLEWCFILLVSTLVLLMEIANSAVERIADVLKPRIHEYIKEMKDIMAAAVMLASVLAIAVGTIILLPYILDKF